MYRIMSMKTAITAVLVTLAAFVTPAFSGNGIPPKPDEIVKIDVLPGWRDAKGHHVAALRIRSWYSPSISHANAVKRRFFA